MRTAATRGRTARIGTLGRLAVAGVCGALLAAVPAGSASAAGHKTWTVAKGQSIQAAVDKASSGDTIKIAAGTFQEAVCIVGKGLTIKGAGREKTTITWPEWGEGKALPKVKATPCWEAQERADEEDDGTTLADDVSALFFYGPNSPVRVQDLGTKNHPANGIVTWGGWGVTVHNTRGVAHERYGVLAADSHHILIKDNVEVGLDRGDPWGSGTAGISVGDSDGASATITRNQVRGYNLGVFAKESRGGTIQGNTLTDGCVGVLVFDDSATEVPDTTRHVEGGDWWVVGNRATANNRYCKVGRDGTQRVSGVGIAVTNADNVYVEGNTIKNHVPKVPAGQDPINFPGGGISLIGFASPPGTNPAGAVDPGTVEDVRVWNNVLSGNKPQDVWITRAIPGSPLRAPGENIVVEDNTCTSSDPKGLCAS
ncbi:hypothetical protein GCM10027586_01740 [Kineococcus gypseus]|uniref:right-handed parallel beta-helix repeat-containing protein n=1 Tax=Kineococcus gypseus TaxID=1637102 RepID=UPI003D7C6E63